MHIGGVMINIEEERKAFEIEWIKLGGDFKSFSIIDNMYVLIPSMASADDVIKEFAERAVNSAFALWLIQSRQKQVVIDDLNIQLKDAKATPEGFVLVPKEMPKSFDEGLYVYSNSISIVDECSEGFIPMSDINHAEVWKLVIEVQEQNQ